MYVPVNDFDAKAWSAFFFVSTTSSETKENKRTVRYGLVWKGNRYLEIIQAVESWERGGKPCVQTT